MDQHVIGAVHGRTELDNSGANDNTDGAALDPNGLLNPIKPHKGKKNKKQKLREFLQLVEDQKNIRIERNLYDAEKKLLVFDINNVLIYRSKFGCSDFQIRPHCKEFLLSMNDRFSLAIWTSMKKRTAKLVLGTILSEVPSVVFKFIWYQTKCIIIKDNNTDAIRGIYGNILNDPKPLFRKDLSIIWKEFTYYSDANTIIVDDSAEKCSNNHSYNCIHPKPYVTPLRSELCSSSAKSACDENEIDIDAGSSGSEECIDYELQLDGRLFAYLDSIARFNGSLKDYTELYGLYQYDTSTSV